MKRTTLPRHCATVPEVDRRTFGHEAFAVQAAEDTRQRADQLAAEEAERQAAHRSADRYIAREPAEPAGIDLAAVIAALPEILPKVMQDVIPERYTPELAAQMVQNIVIQLQTQQSGPVGHFPWCVPGACRVGQDEDGPHAEHIGAQHDVVFKDGGARPLRLTALLSQDADYDPEPTVHLYEDEGNCSILRAEDLPGAAVRLEGLAGAVRQMYADLTRRSDAARIIAQLEANQAAAVAAGLNSPQLEAYHREVVQLVRDSDDPKGVVAEVSQLISRENLARTDEARG